MLQDNSVRFCKLPTIVVTGRVDTDTLVFAYWFQVSDLRERNESIPDTRHGTPTYTVHLHTRYTYIHGTPTYTVLLQGM